MQMHLAKAQESQSLCMFVVCVGQRAENSSNQVHIMGKNLGVFLVIHRKTNPYTSNFRIHPNSRSPPAWGSYSYNNMPAVPPSTPPARPVDGILELPWVLFFALGAPRLDFFNFLVYREGVQK